jgi:gluconokinase
MNASAGPRVIVLMGVSGCGKSTTGTRLSKILGWPFRDADTFHPPGNIAKMSQGLPLTDEDRWPWLAAIAQWIGEQLTAGQSAIVSCSGLKRAYRRQIAGGRTGVQFVHLKGSMELIAERLGRRRRHFMPSSLLQSQFDALEEPAPDEHALVVPITLPPKRVAETIIRELALQPAAPFAAC